MLHRFAARNISCYSAVNILSIVVVRYWMTQLCMAVDIYCYHCWPYSTLVKRYAHSIHLAKACNDGTSNYPVFFLCRGSLRALACHPFRCVCLSFCLAVALLCYRLMFKKRVLTHRWARFCCWCQRFVLSVNRECSISHSTIWKFLRTWLNACVLLYCRLIRVCSQVSR